MYIDRAERRIEEKRGEEKRKKEKREEKRKGERRREVKRRYVKNAFIRDQRGTRNPNAALKSQSNKDAYENEGTQIIMKMDGSTGQMDETKAGVLMDSVTVGVK